MFEVHAVFYSTGKGLARKILQQKASDVLRRPMKDTVGMSEISARLVQTVTADATDAAITVTGDTRHLLDLRMAPVKAKSVSRLSEPRTPTLPTFTRTRLPCQAYQHNGYVLNVTQSLQTLLTPPDEE